MVETINKTLRMSRNLLQELGREPTSEEIAERLGTTKQKVEEALEISRDPVSMDSPLVRKKIPVSEILSKMRICFTIWFGWLSDAEERTGERTGYVDRPWTQGYWASFWLIDGQARTLEEVGKEFKVTRERIRQIEAKALRKLRHPSRSRKLKDFLQE